MLFMTPDGKCLCVVWWWEVVGVVTGGGEVGGGGKGMGEWSEVSEVGEFPYHPIGVCWVPHGGQVHIPGGHRLTL